MSSPQLAATARCQAGCTLAEDTTDPATVDRIADKHTAVGHSTCVTVVPAR